MNLRKLLKICLPTYIKKPVLSTNNVIITALLPLMTKSGSNSHVLNETVCILFRSIKASWFRSIHSNHSLADFCNQLFIVPLFGFVKIWHFGNSLIKPRLLVSIEAICPISTVPLKILIITQDTKRAKVIFYGTSR